MNIALCDVDSKWPNLALMKLSAWHKNKGDRVEWFTPLMAHSYDIVYASKIFTHTPDQEDLPRITTRGGTGYGVPVKLPAAIEAMKPDYSIYPEFTRDIGFLTRGCVRACPWCVVPTFEGKIHQVATFEQIWTGRNEICFLDNNILAMKRAFLDAVYMAEKHNVKIAFNQGLDIRLLDDQCAEALARMPTYEALHFGFDSLDYADEFVKGCQLLRRHRIFGRCVFLFLAGFGSTIAEETDRLKIAVEQKAGLYFMLYKRGFRMHGPFGDVDLLLQPREDFIIRAPIGNLRKYRKAVTRAIEHEGRPIIERHNRSEC